MHRLDRGQASPIYSGSFHFCPADIHRISHAGTEPAVTLHVYSPPLLRMGTYSLTDDTRGQEPMFIEFAEAAGI